MYLNDRVSVSNGLNNEKKFAAHRMHRKWIIHVEFMVL